VYFTYTPIDSEIVNVVAPLFSKINLEWIMGVKNLKTVRQDIASSDLVVAIITPSSEDDMGVWRECMIAETMTIPVVFLVQESVKSDPFAPWSRYKYKKFGDYQQLASRLSLSLITFAQKFASDPVYASSQLAEHSIIDQLKASLDKNVLVLGRDSDGEGMEKINTIKTVLERLHFNGLTLKELPEIEFISLESKMARVAALCRFIIVEDSRASGHIDELKICVTNEFITVIVREAGTGSTWMQSHYPMLYNYVRRFCYKGLNKAESDDLCDSIEPTLEKAVENGIVWANDRIEYQARQFKTFYAHS